MLYRKMPKTGDELSILGFGCMRMPTVNDVIDEPRAIDQIRSAIDQGVNYVDTAWPYHGGASEPLLGKALQGGYRERVKVATKLPSWLVQSREDMDRYLNAQLERLGTDHIDYYLLHTLKGSSWDDLVALGVREFLDAAKADGRIVNAGFSFHGEGKDFARIVDGYDWVFCQIQYNLLDQQYQAGTAGLQYAASKGLGVVIMEPLRGGTLALPEAPPAVATLWDEAATKRTPVEWALRWIWNHPEVTVVLSGMNVEAHIAQNLAVAAVAQAGSLTPAEVALVDRVALKYKELMPVGCTGCAYCLPCPMGVNIPNCFNFFNQLHMFGENSGAKMMYTAFGSGVTSGGEQSYASQCVACGECLEKCPQQIAIPDELEKVAAAFEGPNFQAEVEALKNHFRAGLD